LIDSILDVVCKEAEGRDCLQGLQLRNFIFEQTGAGNNSAKGQTGAGNNWAKGGITQRGAELTDSVSDVILLFWLPGPRFQTSNLEVWKLAPRGLKTGTSRFENWHLEVGTRAPPGGHPSPSGWAPEPLEV
jgi:hypothetical protein